MNFSKHIKEKISQASRGITLLKFLSKYVDRKVLDLSYKLYFRPHLDYGDISYHNQRADLMNLLEQVQYKAALVVSGCWKGTNRERLYEELGWESLTNRRWCRRLVTFYKILNGHTPHYLAEHIPVRSVISQSLRIRSESTLLVRTERYQNNFFPYTMKMWRDLSDEVRSKPSVAVFKKQATLRLEYVTNQS